MDAKLAFNEFLKSVKMGSVQSVTDYLNKVEVNAANEKGKTCLHIATEEGHRDILDIIIKSRSEDVQINIKDKEGNTPLHIACNKKDKVLILFLLYNKASTEITNTNGELPGANEFAVQIFIDDLIEEEKCFGILSYENRDKLREIFKDIDYDKTSRISLENSIAFNKYIDSSIEDSNATRDAKDFMASTAIIDKEYVSLDEWIFSFSKLYYCDKDAFDQFLKDYYNAKESKGTLRETLNDV